jgi:hypothetical protein
LLRRDRLGVDDVLAAELRVVGQRAVEIEPDPIRAITLAREADKHRHFRRGRRRIGTQPLDVRILGKWRAVRRQNEWDR